MKNIQNSSVDELSIYYDTVLNVDKSTYTSTNDEPTPISCVHDMLSRVPEELWKRNDLSILDPCCGNGNFSMLIFFILQEFHSNEDILENILEFNDLNESRLDNVRSVFCNDKYRLKISNDDYLKESVNEKKYDLIVANPPYAKLLPNGKRSSKNHNLIKPFIEKSLSQLKENGFLLYITPDNWMSFADRNTLITKLTSLQIVHLDIHSAKKYFKKIGSSFTWYLIENTPAYKNMSVSGIFKKQNYTDSVISVPRKYIPLYYNQCIQDILRKTVDNVDLEKFKVQTSSDLHKYTKADLIHNEKTEIYKYKLIHTPKQTVYASRPHKFQDGYKVFISTTDKYGIFVDNCGMTQSIVFIICDSKEQAETFTCILNHELYRFINDICRWGNFNNIRILQNFPIPTNPDDIYSSFGITDDEKNLIKSFFG